MKINAEVKSSPAVLTDIISCWNTEDVFVSRNSPTSRERQWSPRPGAVGPAWRFLSGHRLSLNARSMISWLGLERACRTSCCPIKASSVMIASIGPLLSPLFSDEDGRPRELIGHGALQAENKLSGAGCQERRTIRTLPLRKHNVSSCTWLKINRRAKARLCRFILSRACERKPLLSIRRRPVKSSSAPTKPSIAASLSPWAKQDGSARHRKLPCLYFYCMRDIHALNSWGIHRMLCDKRKTHSARTYNTVLLTPQEITKWTAGPFTNHPKWSRNLETKMTL